MSLCECGCGQETGLYTRSRPYLGQKSGEPRRFIRGHNARGKNHYMWNGGISTNNGYRFLRIPNHPRTNATGYVYEHIVIAESVLGKPLPPKAVVHHVNGNPLDNRPGNLIICENNVYHKYLHQRERAYKASGNSNWLRCLHCKKYDNPANLRIYIVGVEKRAYHRECINKYNKKRRNRAEVSQESCRPGREVNP